MANSIDVLICSHKEVEHIGQSLDSLERQSVGREHFRVIVVDNGSDDGTAELVNSYAGRLDLVYVVEPRLGLNFARNTGYGSSAADYIAHLDADARADPDWIAHIREVLGKVQPELCGGPYYPYYVDPKPRWFLDRYNSADLGETARKLNANEYLNGTNMVWRRVFVEKMGGFKPGVGVIGRSLARGDETELILRARRDYPDFCAYYSPDIIVFHLTRANTMSLAYWARRHFNSGRNWQSVFNQTGQSNVQSLKHLLRLCKDAGWRLASGLLSAALFRDRTRYPYLQNFVYEQMLPELALFGALSDRIAPVKRPNRGA